jgi:hypothetical protein
MKKCTLLLLIFCCQMTLIMAQKAISGTITDAQGEPMVGAYINYDGQSRGVATDIDGTYTIRVPPDVKALHISFVGFESQTIAVDNIPNVIALKEANSVLNVYEVIGYSSSCCRCCCTGCWCTVINFYENQQQPLTATPLSNGTIQLTYNIKNAWLGQERGLSKRFLEKTVYYRLKKSTDNLHFKTLGKSVSDTIARVEARWDSTHVTWGVSQFLDKNIVETDSIFYEVEGYTLSGDADDEERAEEIVYRQKVSIAPVRLLKINSLYAEASSEKVDIGLWSKADALTQFSIVDMSGRVVKRFHQNLVAQDNWVTILDCDLIAGTYVLSATQGEQRVSKKFVVMW